MILAEAGYEQDAHDDTVAGAKGLPLPAAIRAIAAGYIRLYRLVDESDINAGMCDDFAADIAALFPGCEAAWGDAVDRRMPGGDGHCVIRRDGRYYDAECPNGVDDVREIPYFAQCREIYEATLREGRACARPATTS